MAATSANDCCEPTLINIALCANGRCTLLRWNVGPEGHQLSFEPSL